MKGIRSIRTIRIAKARVELGARFERDRAHTLAYWTTLQ